MDILFSTLSKIVIAVRLFRSDRMDRDLINLVQTAKEYLGNEGPLWRVAAGITDTWKWKAENKRNLVWN
jgi:hypothetical protein